MYMVYTYGTAQQPLLLEGLHVTNQPAAKTSGGHQQSLDENEMNMRWKWFGHGMKLRFLFNVFQFLTKNLWPHRNMFIQTSMKFMVALGSSEASLLGPCWAQNPTGFFFSNIPSQRRSLAKLLIPDGRMTMGKYTNFCPWQPWHTENRLAQIWMFHHGSSSFINFPSAEWRLYSPILRSTKALTPLWACREAPSIPISGCADGWREPGHSVSEVLPLQLPAVWATQIINPSSGS